MRSQATSSEEQRALLQDRLYAMYRALGIIYVVLALAGAAALVAGPNDGPPNVATQYLVTLVGMLATLVAWGVTRSWWKPSLSLLRATDAAATLSIAICLSIQVVLNFRYATSMPEIQYIFITNLVMLRALLVPSSATRTAVISSLASGACLVATAYAVVDFPEGRDGTPLAAVIGYSVVVAAGTVAIATLGSWVIYGLRRQVAEALQLGQYTLREKIGQGGMGAVYRATHAMLRRPTAIKLLHEAEAGAIGLTRFEREVQLTAELNHPNIIAIYDYGRSPQGVFYYAMELLDGMDLESLVADHGALPPGRVRYLLRQAADGLAEAHARGLVHRDIKPANILVSRLGSRADVVKVVDFGLVRDLSIDDRVTVTNAIAGTPAYLSPEAISTPDEVGPKADLYALGAVAYFLLTGTRVFLAETIASLCAKHLFEEPEPFSERTEEPIPADFEALVLRCLAKLPADRPPSAAALRDLLDELDLAEWTQADAADWWDSRQPSGAAAAGDAPEILTIDLRARQGQASTVPARRK